MRTFLVLCLHLMVSVAKLIGPGGRKGLLAEMLLLKHQLLVTHRARRKAPNLKTGDRISMGFWSPALVDVIVEMKQRNPRYGCPRIAQQISRAFGVEIDKDVVRRVLAKYYRPGGGGGGPLVVDVHRSCERQSMERGSVSV
jgi:putative transposase